MGIVKKFIRRFRKPEDLFEGAPCLSPWYFDEAKPKLLRNGQILKWSWIEKISDTYVGALTLRDSGNNCYGILKTYTYILANPKKDSFLIWTRSNDVSVIKISFYMCDDLKTIEASDEIILDLKGKETESFFFNCEPRSIVSIDLNLEEDSQDISFPIDYKSFPDFCVVTNIPGLYKDGNEQWNNTAIVLIRPGNGKISIYPQDWFNKSDTDFGYQWITRAVEDPVTGLIHGQGIRIKDFVFNKSNK